MKYENSHWWLGFNLSFRVPVALIRTTYSYRLFVCFDKHVNNNYSINASSESKVSTANANENHLSPTPFSFFLGLPIPKIESIESASAVVLADKELAVPAFTGVAEAMQEPGVDVRLFGKPNARPYRRMAVALAKGKNALERAKNAAAKIQVIEKVDP